ncbi:hypothetical protein ACF1G0_33815 [Streptomyces sp. NPDC013953]|uniref:hypothetical protein n=1 Tax=Streptomyces sp. NPDC013953 TaxID=3364868 RepID=UPI0036F5DE1A
MDVTRDRKTRAMAIATVATVVTGLLAGGLVFGPADVFGSDAPSAHSADMVAQAGSAESAKGSKASRSSCWTGAVQIRNKQFIKTVYDWPDTPGAQASIPGPGKKIFEYKLEVSNKVSATLGASYSQISAGLGFEVNKTQTITDRTEIELPKPVQYRVRAGMIYKQYRFDVYRERGFWNWHGDYLVCSSHRDRDWVNQGSSTALNPWMEAFRKTKTPKRTTH